ncbi:MAG: hypothetical protein MJ076_06305, partial [Clostridia bacterium]|nr:hypothetical protein [Clostridia bacterium]
KEGSKTVSFAEIEESGLCSDLTAFAQPKIPFTIVGGVFSYYFLPIRIIVRDFGEVISNR